MNPTIAPALASAVTNAPADKSPRYVPVHMHPYWTRVTSTTSPNEGALSYQAGDSLFRDDHHPTSLVVHFPALASIQHRVPSLARLSPISALDTGYFNTQGSVTQHIVVTTAQPDDELPATNVAVAGFLSHLDELEHDHQQLKKEGELYTDALQRPRYSAAEEAKHLAQRANRTIDEATSYHTRVIAWRSSGLAEVHGHDLPKFEWGHRRKNMRSHLGFLHKDPKDEVMRKLAMSSDERRQYHEEVQRLNACQGDATVATHWNAWTDNSWAKLFAEEHKDVNGASRHLLYTSSAH